MIERTPEYEAEVGVALSFSAGIHADERALPDRYPLFAGATADHAHAGERVQLVVCMCAREFPSGRELNIWECAGAKWREVAIISREELVWASKVSEIGAAQPSAGPAFVRCQYSRAQRCSERAMTEPHEEAVSMAPLHWSLPSPRFLSGGAQIRLD
jgi:hypothetical protein